MRVIARFTLRNILSVLILYLLATNLAHAQIVKVNQDSVLIEYIKIEEPYAKGEFVESIFKELILDSFDTYFLADLLDQVSGKCEDCRIYAALSKSKKSSILIKLGYRREAIRFSEESIPLVVDVIDKLQQGDIRILKYKKKLAGTHINLGLRYAAVGEKGKAMGHLEKALVYSKEIENASYIQKCLTVIGDIYVYVADYEQAIDYYIKAMGVEDTVSIFTIGTYNSLGDAYCDSGNPRLGLEYLMKANELSNTIKHKNAYLYKIRNLVSLHVFYGDTGHRQMTDSLFLLIKELSDQHERYYSLFFRYLAEIDARLFDNQLVKAEALLNDAEIIMQLENDDMVSHFHLTKAKIFLHKAEYSIARTHANKALELSLKTGRKEPQQKIYNLLSEIETKAGNYKLALKHFKERQALLNVIKDGKIEMNKDILLIKYEAVKKNNEINSLHNKEISSQIEISRQSTLSTRLLAGISVLGLLAIGFFWNNHKTQITNKLLTEKSIIIRAKSNQNEVLLKEIHHRIKNNLQTVSSLLYLQSGSIKDSDAKEAIVRGRQRVESIALIHKNLYQCDNLTSVEMSDYISKLIKNLKSTFVANGQFIDVNLNMGKVELDVDTAIPLGLIVNELVTNILKYAFPNQRDGTIFILLEKSKEDGFKLGIRDNGIGRHNSKDGFGTQLVTLLTKQLNARFTEGNDEGYWIEISR